MSHILSSRQSYTGIPRTYWVPIGATLPRTTDGAEATTEEYTTNDINLDLALFDGSTEEAVNFQTVFPEEWNLGTVKARVYCDIATGASAGDKYAVGLSMGAYSNDDPIDAALGTEVVISDTVLAVGDLHVSDASAAITVGGTPQALDLIVGQIARKPDHVDDDMTEDLKIVGVLFQYTESQTEPTAW